MTAGADDLPPRLYGTEQEIRAISAGLVACDLPRAAWTHEGHLAAVSVLLLCHPEIALEQDLPGIISRFNTSVGGVNDDHQGYHETLTQFWIATARAFHAGTEGDALLARVNRFIGAPEGRRAAPLAYYSRALLFSVEARRRLVEPDLMRFAWDTAA
jgi:hypothetical protein